MLTREKRMRLWTYLLDPPVVAIAAFVSLYIAKPLQRNLGACLTGVVCAGIIPLAAWLYLIAHRGDYKGERKAGFVLSIAGYVVGTVIMIVFFRHSRLNLAFMMSYTITVAGLALVNLLHYKASGHADGAAGPITALTIIYGWWGLVSLILLALVAVSKFSVKDHTVGQLCTGAAIAVISTVAAFAVTGIL